jgi:hypothetical protein
VLLFAGLAFALLAWWTTHAALRRELRAIGNCRGRYAAAHSFRDTAAVDMTYLNLQGKQAPSRRGFGTCGDLRLAGRLR